MNLLSRKIIDHFWLRQKTTSISFENIYFYNIVMKVTQICWKFKILMTLSQLFNMILGTHSITPKTEAAVQKCSVKKVFLEISQNSQENTCARVTGIRPVTLFKKRLWRRCFPVNCVKFLRTPFIIEHFWWLLLQKRIQYLSKAVTFRINVRKQIKLIET